VSRVLKTWTFQFRTKGA